MSIFWAAVIAWFGWHVGAPLLLGLVALIIVGLCSIPGVIRRARCKHLRFYENRACDAVCSDCGKNLGFIDNARKRLSH